MSADNQIHLSRRSFVRRTGLLAGGALIGGSATLPPAVAQTTPLSGATDDKPWPTRVLGKTGVSVTTMTLGTAPCGLSPKIPPREIAKIVNEALDLGINSIDTAPAYKQSEEGIGLALGERRKEVFLATKVMADTIEDAEKSLAKSFELLKTDWFDLVYYHSVGDRDIEAGMKPDGVFSWLIKQKQAGKFRFLGISGHNRPAKFVPLLETGEVDVLLAIVNFVDRYTYGFEHKVFPLARHQNVPIVAMKVFGGAKADEVRGSQRAAADGRRALGDGHPFCLRNPRRRDAESGSPQLRAAPPERGHGQAFRAVDRRPTRPFAGAGQRLGPRVGGALRSGGVSRPPGQALSIVGIERPQRSRIGPGGAVTVAGLQR
jgi:uncharacterized protein